MKQILCILTLLASTGSALADPCHERFTELLVEGDGGKSGAVRIHITQEIVGGKTSLNYHYSDGNGNGMTEMIDPENDPWSLFLGDNMYRSDDKGKTWSFMNSFDMEKSRLDTKKKQTKDAATATDLVCGEEELNGEMHETVAGTYKSSLVPGATMSDKYWVHKVSGRIVKKFGHTKSNGFESKTTQVIEPAPDLVLPKVD